MKIYYLSSKELIQKEERMHLRNYLDKRGVSKMKRILEFSLNYYFKENKTVKTILIAMNLKMYKNNS
jgi:hypothetical protein